MQAPRHQPRQLPCGRPQTLGPSAVCAGPAAFYHRELSQSSELGAGQPEEQQRKPPFRLCVTSCHGQNKNSDTGGPCFARLLLKAALSTFAYCPLSPQTSSRIMETEPGQVQGQTLLDSELLQPLTPSLCLIVRFISHDSLLTQNELSSRRFLYSPKQTEGSPEGHPPVL